MKRQTSQPSKPLTLTVGITTCYGDPSILETVKSLRSSKNVGEFQFLIVSDRKPFDARVKLKLEKYGVELIENETSASQTTKHKQILNLAKGDVLVLTQDDVLFSPDTLAKILKCFQSQPKLVFASVLNKPIHPTSLLEGILNIGTNLNNRIARLWNNGDNYLSVVGRCLAYRTDWIKSHFDVPEIVATTDTFHYLNIKKHGAVYKYLLDAVLYFKNPQKWVEFLRKSSRFQYSQQEMSQYFGDVTQYYQIPFKVKLRALIAEFLLDPFRTVAYLIIFFYSRFFRLPSQKVLNPIWEVDLSTKLTGSEL